MILTLAKAGVSVFRLNCSHGKMEEHARNLGYIRQAEEKVGRHLGALFDLQGPKLRIGRFVDDKDFILQSGQSFRVDLDPALGDDKRVTLPHPEIFAVMGKDMVLLVNDGKIKLRVKEFGKDWADTEVVTGGVISNNKGINVPDVTLPISALTDKDKNDLKSALELGADLIGLSFVQRPEDVKMTKDLIGGKAMLVCKIEKPTALEHLEEIIALTDAVMVARGDLGVECPIQKVPVFQKNIISSCRKAGKPVIVATQMLESMIQAPLPTRAEVSDVANAVYEGADAVMLSGETAVGQYPELAVTMMTNIITEVETDPRYEDIIAASRPETKPTYQNAITSAARQASTMLKKARAIVNYTASGNTAFRMAKERPFLPLIAMTPSINIARQLALCWGVRSMVVHQMERYDEFKKLAIAYAKQNKMAVAGDELIITGGVPLGVKGRTNMLNIVEVD